MKVVINRCFGGFSLSVAAALAAYEGGMTELGTPVDKYFGGQKEDDEYGLNALLAEWRTFLADTSVPTWRQGLLTIFSKDESHVVTVRPSDAQRADPRLVAVVERMGEAANGAHAKLAVVEIPDGIEWVVHDYDGMESIQEAHRSWS